MSNRTDFFQSQENKVTLPAGSVSVFLDGSLCGFLEVKEIVRDGWDGFSYARLVYNAAAYSGAASAGIEEIKAVLQAGQRISICQVYNGAAPAATIKRVPLFSGRIETVRSSLNGDGEGVEIITRDFSSTLEHIKVYGMRVNNADGANVFLDSQKTIFNEYNQANASADSIENNGFAYTVFCGDSSSGRLWNYADVIDYLLCEYLPAGLVGRPDKNQLKALGADRRVYALDVTGLSLLEALHRCCQSIGLAFKFVARLSDSGPDEAIVFYRPSAGRAVELNYQQAGERVSISKTDAAELASVSKAGPVTNYYIGRGHWKIYEATFELVKAWDPALEDSDSSKFSPATNENFYQVRDVYRKWCLNEAGDYSGEPYNQGAAFDFSGIFEGSAFLARRRRFWPCLNSDEHDNSLGYFLEISYDNGVTWSWYVDAFENLADQCGLWLSSATLDEDLFTAAQADELKMRITASVVSDGRLYCSVADGPISSAADVTEHIINAGATFQYRRVTGESIFFAGGDSNLGRANEADDSEALYEFVRQKALAENPVIEKIRLKTAYLMFDYRVGDRVTHSPESRDLLDSRTDNRSMLLIEQVKMDFEKQFTELQIVRRRKVEV
jgi:hypothetical protein